jgi:hypothetical protein
MKTLKLLITAVVMTMATAAFAQKTDAPKSAPAAAPASAAKEPAKTEYRRIGYADWHVAESVALQPRSVSRPVHTPPYDCAVSN